MVPANVGPTKVEARKPTAVTETPSPTERAECQYSATGRATVLEDVVSTA